MTEIVSFSLSKGMLERIDIERSDVSRSKFIRKLLEVALKEGSKQKRLDDEIRIARQKSYQASNLAQDSTLSQIAGSTRV